LLAERRDAQKSLWIVAQVKQFSAGRCGMTGFAARVKHEDHGGLGTDRLKTANR
jgi:hypothetical protein